MAGDADDVEWLDTEPPPRRAVPPPPRRAWYLLLGAVAVAVVLVLALTRHETKRAAAQSPRPTPTPTTSAAIVASESGVAPRPPVSLINLGRPLLNVPPTWELVARGSDSVYRIQLATGRIVATSAPIASSGPVSLVVGPHEVIVRPWDCVPGYLIRDGRPASDLRGMLAHCGPALPGPKPDQVWVQTGEQDQPRMVLVGLDGRSAGVSVADQEPGGLPDGAGYPMVNLVGGVYDSRADGLHRITTGTVLATGPTGWLAEECDDRHRCTLDVIDRPSGAHRAIGQATDTAYRGGLISPNGAMAALATPDPGDREVVLHVIDLHSGTDRATPVVRSGDEDLAAAIVWSPDSQWLFAVDAEGRIVAVDRAGHLHTLDTRLPAIEQLAIR